MNRLSTKYERRNHEESGINSHLYDASLRTLSDPATTTLVLVSRPERGALAEANRTRAELAEMGVLNQHLILNGMFVAQDRDDSAACALEACGKASLDGMPPELAKLPSSQVPLLPFAPMGVGNLRQVFGPGTPVCSANGRHRYQSAESDLSLSSLIDGIESAGRGVVLTMGKGGVGKTTIASAIATELARRGHAVHLSTTEAARLQDDLKRAGITPFAWVVNQSFGRDGISDPILIERRERERSFLAEVRERHSRRTAVVPWEPIEPVGADLLLRLAGGSGSLSVRETIRE